MGCLVQVMNNKKAVEQLKADVALAKTVHGADVKRLQQELELVGEELENTKQDLRDSYGQVAQLRQEVDDLQEDLASEKRAHEDTQTEVRSLVICKETV